MTEQGKGRKLDEGGVRVLDEIIQALRENLENLEAIRGNYSEYTYEEVASMVEGFTAFHLRSKILLLSALGPEATESWGIRILRSDDD